MPVCSISRRKIGVSAFGAALGMVSLSNLARAASAEKHARAEMSITDVQGRPLKGVLSRRVVCIGGTVTETLYELGVSDRICAVDTTSTRPIAALREKASLGYMRMISAEGVLSLQPDLIVAMRDMGPPAALSQLIASHVPVVLVDSTPSPEAIIARTRFLGRVVGASAQGDALADKIAAQFHTVAQWRADHPSHTRVLFVMRMTNGHPMAAGAGTAADAIIGLAGAVNAGATMQGYKILDNESLTALHPDVILIMEQGSDTLRSELQKNAGFHLTPAGKKNAVIAMEGERLLGFGPHTSDAVLELARELSGVTAL